MEAINNVASVATRAVWGNGHTSQEPVSGVQGDVSKGEPYDAGNLEPHEQKKVESRLSNDKPNKEIDAMSPVTDDTPSGQNDTRHPNDASTDTFKANGAGPKPLDQDAPGHGGDVGHEKEDAAGMMEDAPNNDTEKSGETATGQEHVKTTGFAAEGGDFDATKPGAGREADRLLEKKGIDRDDHSAMTASPGTPNGSKSSAASTPSKQSKLKRSSLSQRIKAKFHRN